MYKKDASKRGQSLALAQILQSLADNPSYHEFSEMLRQVRRDFLEIGRADAENLIVESLRNEATQIYEICEDTGLSEIAVKFYLGKLIKSKKANKRLNYGLNQYEYYLTGK
jgi:hypothetical protein